MPELSKKQIKKLLNSAKNQLAGTLSSWETSQIADILNPDGGLLLSTNGLKSILEKISQHLNYMLCYVQIGNHINEIDPLSQDILQCLSPQGHRIQKSPNSQDISTEIPRSFIYRIINDSIEIDVLTNTKLADGTLNPKGFLGYGTYKKVKASVRFVICNNTITNQFLARARMNLAELKKNGGIKDQTKFTENLKELQHEVFISKKYKSPYFAELEAGPTFDKKNLELRKAYTFSGIAIGTLGDMPFTTAEIYSIEKDRDQERIPYIVYKLFNDILEGLKVMHQHGDVHGDLKPDNVLIFRDEQNGELRAKLTDFGLATLAIYSAEEKINAIGGTGYYASPEVTHYIRKHKPNLFEKNMSLVNIICPNNKKIQNIKQNDAKHDMWSFGASLLTMLIFKIFDTADFKTNKGVAAKKILQHQMREHPILKELLAPNMNDRPSAKRAQELLRLDHLLTYDVQEYDEKDFELLNQHYNNLLNNSTVCCGLFSKTIKHHTPHNNLELVANKINAMERNKPFTTQSTCTTASSTISSLQLA